MEKKSKKSVIPSKEDLIGKLMEVVNGYDGTSESTVRPTDAIRAIEVLAKFLGYNEADKQEVKVEEFVFEIG